MADVFISYKRAERARVDRIAQLLRGEELDVWFDARLDVGSGEGFDAEIEREVTSAACVLVCWTQEALKSVYVRAEAMKGLERDVLHPVFLERCNLPVPFNAIDTADLCSWNGKSDAPDWQRLVASVRARVDKSKADDKQRRAHSQAAYDRIPDHIFPGTLTILARRIAAIRERDAEDYHGDIMALLSWLESIAEKEARHTAYGYDLADRQCGGDAWRWWDRGGAAARSSEISCVRDALLRVEAALARSQELLDLPAP
ncbi:MAG: toll/interleukin-1 receptor domain-containing protein [Nitrospira sp.]|nr:toll/interleukin-1 receptor domain-containing protein [Nitrospira sp.]